MSTPTPKEIRTLYQDDQLYQVWEIHQGTDYDPQPTKLTTGAEINRLLFPELTSS